MKENILLGCLLSFFACLSCSESNTKAPVVSPKVEYLNYFERDSTHDVIINLDAKTKIDIQTIRYFQYNSKEYLLFLNELTNSIYKYDINENVQPEVLTFEKIGPTGVGRLTGFDIHNIDTLLLLARYDYKLTLVSKPWKQYKLNVYRLSGRNAEFTPDADTQTRIISLNNKIYASSFPFFRMGTSTFVQQGNNLMVLDMSDSSVELKNIYTDLYEKNWSAFYGRTNIAFNEKEKRFLVSMAAESGLSSFIDPDQVEYTPVNSEMVREVNEFKGDHNDRSAEQMHQYENPIYLGLHYDEFRDTYYRFVNMPNEDAIGSGDEQLLRKRNLIVQVLNNKLELIGEQSFPPYYFFKMVFVGKRGLYIAQPEVTEDGFLNENVVRYAFFNPEAGPK